MVLVEVEQVSSHAAQNEIAKRCTVQIGNNIFPRIQLYAVESRFDEEMLNTPRMPEMINPYTGQSLLPSLPLTFSLARSLCLLPRIAYTNAFRL